MALSYVSAIAFISMPEGRLWGIHDECVKGHFEIQQPSFIKNHYRRSRLLYPVAHRKDNSLWVWEVQASALYKAAHISHKCVSALGL